MGACGPRGRDGFHSPLEQQVLTPLLCRAGRAVKVLMRGLGSGPALDPKSIKGLNNLGKFPRQLLSSVHGPAE